MVLDPEKFLEMAETATYANASVRFPLLQLSGEAKKIDDNLYEKEILKLATIEYKGRQIKFDSDFLKALKENYDVHAAEGNYVPLQFVTDENKHTDDPRYYGGEIVSLSLDNPDEPTSVIARFKLEKDAQRVVEAQPRIGVSISASYMEDLKGRLINPDLKHVAMTHREKLKGMKAWQKVAASEELNTIDLSDAEVTFAEDTVVIDDTNDESKGGKVNMSENGTQNLELTDDLIERILTSDKGKGIISLAIEDATKEKNEKIETLEASLSEVQSKTYAKSVELAVESYANKGVPKVARDLAQGLLLSFANDAAELKIELTEGSGDDAKTVELSRHETVIKMLEEFEGFVNMTKEQGSSKEETVELAQDDNVRTAAINFLTGKAKANNQ